jgi:hypothetical protein
MFVLRCSRFAQIIFTLVLSAGRHTEFRGGKEGTFGTSG